MCIGTIWSEIVGLQEMLHRVQTAIYYVQLLGIMRTLTTFAHLRKNRRITIVFFYTQQKSILKLQLQLI